MQYLNIRKANRLLMALALFTGGAQTAFAVGTPSNTAINNTATVDYQVGTDARTASGAAPEIRVDNRVDLTVTNQDGGNVDVAPGTTNQIQTYTVTNTGNTSQGYLLTVTGDANIPMGNVRIFVDLNKNGIPDAGELYAGSNMLNVDPNTGTASDAEMQVLVVADTPAAATNGFVENFYLVAQTTAAVIGTNTPISASGSPDVDPLVVDVVFADGAGTNDALRDGQFSDEASYTVVSADLTAAKTIANIADEFSATGGFAIPGAVVRYQIAISNGLGGTVDADTVVVSDPIPANTKLCVAVGTACTAADLPTFAAGTSGLTGAAFEYSDDNGTTWAATPNPDAQGADTAITNVRQSPTGTMSAGGAFDITIGVVIE